MQLSCKIVIPFAMKSHFPVKLIVNLNALSNEVSFFYKVAFVFLVTCRWPLGVPVEWLLSKSNLQYSLELTLFCLDPCCPPSFKN